MGGSNEEINLIKLLPREHFLVHWLLYELNTDNKKLACAFMRMCNGGNDRQFRYIPSSRIYEYAKKSYSKLLTGRVVSIETRQKLSKSLTGKKHSAETRKKISDVQKGKTLSMETRQKISASLMGVNKGIIRSQEIRDILSAAAKTRKPRKLTEEHKRKIGIANFGRRKIKS
jgi:hypothetical protein